MTILFASELSDSVKTQLWQMLLDGDKEFVPALSSRNNTSQTDLLDCASSHSEDGPRAYYDVLIQQQFLLAMEWEQLVGFLSFSPNKSMSALIPNWDVDAVYVSTILVAPTYRRKGITTAMYEKLFELYPAFPIATRTWSRNTSHIAILEKKGFQLVHSIPDDRGPGIDTVYYMRNN